MLELFSKYTKCPILNVIIGCDKCKQCEHFINFEDVRDDHGHWFSYEITCRRTNEIELTLK